MRQLPTLLSLFTFTLIAMTLVVNPATAASVESACAADYFSYCSKHNPDSPGVRSCMRANGARLSQRCVNALVANGEVSQAEVSRKTARR
jgi:hypothetical protein